MVFVPLPFFATLVLVCAVIVMLATRDIKIWTNRLFISLVGLYAVQSFLLCLRWGYGYDGIGWFIAGLAPVLPTVAYLAYLTLIEKPSVHWVWLLAVVLINWIILFAIPDLADVSILATYIGIGVALLLRAFKGSDAMALARMTRARHAVLAMTLTGASLVASGMLDIFVLFDFITTGGQNVGLTVTLAQSGFLLCVGAAALVGQLGATEQESGPQDQGNSLLHDPEDADVHRRISDLFLKDALHRDTDLNLRRLARRLSLPDRTVSRAINRIESQSVSQFVNTFRIMDACKLLVQTDQSILQISLASGFLTKSNFNREFLRVTGRTPSHWRREKVQVDRKSEDGPKLVDVSLD